MKKTMTISYCYSSSDAKRPFIRITNDHLEENGFKIGDKIEVDYQSGQIIIKPLKKQQTYG